MFELTAYTFSDVMVVTEVMSQVAMIFNGNVFEVAAKTAGLIGIVLALFMAIFRSAQLSPTTFFWPILVAVLMIVPRVDLVIEDKDGGLSRVDNLPIGFAAPTALITTMGAGIGNMLTENLGLADNAITMDNGHLMSLRAPIVFQQVLTTPGMAGDAAVFPNGLSSTVDVLRYVTRCVPSIIKSYDPDNVVQSYRQLVSLPISSFRGTTAHTVLGSNGTTYECEQYFDAIMSGFESEGYHSALRGVVSQVYGKHQGDTTTGSRYYSALENAVGDPSEFFKAASFANAIAYAPTAIGIAGGGGSQAAALEDALNQKREQNYGTAAVVFETITTFISFLEVWSFSLMPLVLLLMMIGPMGAKLASKYFWMLVWIQFWYPTLLITMSFLDISLSNISISSMTTITRYNAFMYDLMRLQDTGYMALSMATALSMFIVFGASSALGAQMQRDTTGMGHYDPKKNEPDTVNRAAHHSFQGAWLHPSSYGGGSNSTMAYSQDNNLANINMSLDRRLSSAFSASELASFAGTGTITTGQTSAHTLGNGSGETRTVGTTRNQAYQGSMLRTNNLSSGWSQGEDVSSARSRTDTDSLSVGVGATGQMGAGLTHSFDAGAVIPGAGRGRGSSGQPGGRNNDESSTTGTFSLALSGRASVEARESQADSLQQSQRLTFGNNAAGGLTTTITDNQTITDSDTISRIGTENTTEQNSRTDQVGITGTVQHSETEQEGRTYQDGTYSSVSQQISVRDAAMRAASNPNVLRQLQELSHDARMMPVVDQFIRENEANLNSLFYGDAKQVEDSKFAFASIMVSQGMYGNLYADDVENGQDRRDAVNAIADEIVRSSYFGSGAPIEGRPALDSISSESVPSEADMRERLSRGNSGFNISQEAARDMVSRITDFSNADQSIRQLRDMLGGDPAALSEGQANGIVSENRNRIDEHYGAIDSEKQSNAAIFRQHGFIGALLTLAGRDQNEVENSVSNSFYNDAADEAGMPVRGAERHLTPENAPNNGQDPYEKMVDVATGYFLNDSILSADTNVGRYMIATNFAANAAGRGDEHSADRFREYAESLVDREPMLAPEHAGTIVAGLSVDGFNARDVARAEAEIGHATLVDAIGNLAGFQLFDDGSKTQWGSPSPSGSASRGMEGGTTTFDHGSQEDILLTHISAYEGPRGYNDYERASTQPPPREITNMTVGEIAQWQQARTRGVDTRAAGKYQFTHDTLLDTARSAGVSLDTPFTAQVQDRMALHLINKNGDLDRFNDGGSSDVFGRQLANHWAALPMMTGAAPDLSVYHGEQGNRALLPASEMSQLLSVVRGAPRSS